MDAKLSAVWYHRTVMKKLKTVFIGTSEFSLPFLFALAETEDLRAVFTRPDRPAGRKKIITPPPAKTAALKLGLDVFQPEDINSPDSRAALSSIAPDLIVVVSYGGFLKKQVLGLPPLGCVNIHPSLLPRYRGPCPIEHTLLNGDAVTGVCCIMMDEGMDSGGIIHASKIPVDVSDTAGTLAGKLMDTGVDVLKKSLKKIKSGSCSPAPQKGEPAYAPFIHKKDAVIDWRRPAPEIHNLIRALSPCPGARSGTDIKGKKVIIRKSSLPASAGAPGEPGRVRSVSRRGALVSCGEGNILIKEVQPEGKTAQSTQDFLRGNKIEFFR